MLHLNAYRSNCAYLEIQSTGPGIDLSAPGCIMLDEHACLCEHVKHFDEWPDGKPGHEYGKEFPDSELGGVVTPFGTYVVCKDCSETCLLEYSK